ncbi:MAG TPA: ExeM/NucH family extracellular endonuclease [Jiangellaceae bacterium]
MHPSRSRALGTLCVVAATAAGTVAAPSALAVEPTVPFISEFHYDNTGTDAGEFVEVQVPPGASTAGWSIVLYNGAGGASYDTDALPAVSPPAGGASAVAVIDYAVNGIQNGSPDGIALVDAANTLVEFLSYEGTFAGVGGPADGVTSVDIGVSESGAGAVGNSLSKRLNPATENYEWQAEAPNTRDALNPPLEPPVEQCDLTPGHDIGAVQGSGFSTPLAGQEVSVRGVVVGDVPGLGGFYVQDDGDGDAATSDGIFVATSTAVALGDTVAVAGTAGENFGETRITAGAVDVCSTGSEASLPAATPLDLPAVSAAREPLEGMLVESADVLTVSEVFNLTRFGELMLSEGGLLVQPTELADAGSDEAAAIAAANEQRRIVLDDGTNASRSAANRPYLSPDTPVRVGDELDFTSPLVLGFGFGNWRFQPADGTPEGTFAPQNTRPAAPDAVGGDVQIGAFNVLNYFLTLAADGGRGAETPEEFEKQAAKIVTAIEALGADVVTLMEIEDTNSTGFGNGTPDQAVADLVSRLNVEAGFDKWAYVPLPDELLAVDRDVIRNAIIYQNDVVAPVGEPVGLVDESVWFNAREPIAQTFVKDGDPFTVIANHFKSKSDSVPPQSGNDNEDIGDGQGAFNGDRVRQAASLADFAEELRESSGDDDVLIMGDLNAYSEEDPIQLLRGVGFTDLGAVLDAGRYSFVFNALSGSLDHAMSSDALTGKVTDVAHWNINAVESFAYQYDGDPELYAANPFRSSDHDPLVLGVDLEERCVGLTPTIRGTDGPDTLTGTTKPDVIMGLGGNDVIRGGNDDDVICGGAGDDVLRGENGVDTLLGGFGDDVLFGGNGDDSLIGGPGSDVLNGGGGANQLEQEGPES